MIFSRPPAFPPPAASDARTTHETLLSLELDRQMELPTVAALHDALRQAHRFSQSWTPASALRKLVAVDIRATPILAPATGHRCLLQIAGGTLGVLAEMASALRCGWTVVAEDCDFSRRYLGRLAARSELSFCRLERIPGRAAAALHRPRQKSHLFVTFMDRALTGYTGTMSVTHRWGTFHLMEADALIAQLPFDQILDSTGHALLPALGPAKVGDSRFDPDRLRQITEAAFVRLTEETGHAPARYMAWPALATRSAQHRLRQLRAGRAMLKSYLLCARMRTGRPERSPLGATWTRLSRLPLATCP